MTARTTTTTASSQAGRELTSEVGFLTRALKAPTLRDAVPRLAERARAESWTHEEFLVACLQREVSARASHLTRLTLDGAAGDEALTCCFGHGR